MRRSIRPEPASAPGPSRAAPRRALAMALAALAGAAAAPAPAQGDYVHFEHLPVQGLDVARIAGVDYLLACNTPDNSVEVYGTIDNRLLFRVPVGQAPVTVEWNPTWQSFYTCNFLGDSVSMVQLLPPSGSLPLRARPLRTSLVGDEPTDIEFLPDSMSFFVTLQSRGAIGWYGALDLVAVGGLARIPLTFPLLDPAAQKAIKNPRRVLWDGLTLLILGQHGGQDPAVFDFDLYGFDLMAGVQQDLGGLGSINQGLRLGKDGRLYVVGNRVRNDVLGEDALRALPDGFVQSFLFVVDAPGKPGAGVRARNLHLDPQGQVVPRDRAVASPVDVELLEQGSTVEKVFVAGFAADRIGVLHPDGGPPAAWPMTWIDVPNPQGFGYARTGPRAMVMKYPSPTALGDPGTRLYVLNALGHSISVIDPATEQELRRIPLRNDPTPQVVRDGREFLYSAELSGNGFVSCSSCHIDGRTDGQVWDLGDKAGGDGPMVPPELVDGVTGQGLGSVFPKDKGRMVTQTLQGLVNHPVNAQAQYLFSNAPHHWRGDRPSFQAFNGAFVTLLGAPNLGTKTQPQGIPAAAMNVYAAFVHKIMYPPNPEQPLTRRFSGSLGDPDLEDGTGGRRGLKLFHTRAFPNGGTGGRSCVQCHALPEGSNNRITETGGAGGTGPQPIETAALRGLFEREGRLEESAITLSDVVWGQIGLLHTGENGQSLNGFVFQTFGGSFPGPELFKLADVTRFLRELDWGIAPLVGGAFTVDPQNRASPVVQHVLALVEGQVREANAGLAVYARTGRVERGFWFDVTVDPPAYREEGAATLLDRQGLLALVQGGLDRLILQATPVGSARRIASLDGTAAPLSGPAPSAVTLLSMAPSTAWEDVPRLRKNWPKGTGPDDFHWHGLESPGVPAKEPVSLKAIRIYQQALIQKAPQLGVTAERHEAPRRFRVAGRDLRPGARLVLLIPADATPPPYGAGEKVQVLDVELFPTDQRTVDGRPIWETTVEVAPLVLYALLCGGPFAPDVVDAHKGLVPEPPPPSAFDPLGWNLYHALVRNADGTAFDAGWQRLTIE